MNIEFKIMAHGYEKAGKVEKVLKELGIPYEERIATPVSAKKRHTKTKITKEVAAVILTAIDKHPDWSCKDLGRACGVSHNTIHRFMNGEHPLSIQSLRGVK